MTTPESTANRTIDRLADRAKDATTRTGETLRAAAKSAAVRARALVQKAGTRVQDVGKKLRKAGA